MKLYLVRHGEAKSENEDPKRPLSDRGREDVDSVSQAAAKKGMAASRILHSDKLRAKQTAEILARNITPTEGICEVKGLGPEDDPSLTKAELEASGRSLILVGHLPHLARLTSILLNGDSCAEAIDFPTASVVCLSRGKGEWKVKWTMDPAGVRSHESHRILVNGGW